MRLKSAEDQDIYNRYKDGHDGTMSEYLKWHKRGKKPKTYASAEHKRARKVIIEMLGDHTRTEIANRFNTYVPLIDRIVAQNYRHVPAHKAQYIAERRGIPDDPPDTGPTQEQEKKAIKLLKEAGAEDNLKQFCRKHDLDYKPVYCTVKGRYATVHKVVEEIIKKLG